MKPLSELLDEFRREMDATQGEQSVRDLQARYLGRKGLVTEQQKQLGTLPKEARPGFGQELNRVKGAIEAIVVARLSELAELERARELSQKLDVTLPGRQRAMGRLHP